MCAPISSNRLPSRARWDHTSTSSLLPRQVSETRSLSVSLVQSTPMTAKRDPHLVIQHDYRGPLGLRSAINQLTTYRKDAFLWIRGSWQQTAHLTGLQNHIASVSRRSTLVNGRSLPVHDRWIVTRDSIEAGHIRTPWVTEQLTGASPLDRETQLTAQGYLGCPRPAAT